MDTAIQTTAASRLIQTLHSQGVGTVFGYPGGAIMPVYDALVGAPLRHILTRHEQGAALAADGYARASGRVGVCFGTSGPGATNLLTGVANAYLDSVPMLVVTGQVPSPLIGTDAFQEVDTFGMSLPVVKHSYMVKAGDDIAEVVAEGLKVAAGGRPGPVLIDVPKDLAASTVDHGLLPPIAPPTTHSVDAAALAAAQKLLVSSRRPLAYIGGGVALAHAENELRRFIEENELPAVSTLQGLGAIDTDHRLHLGMLGMHGSEAANHAVQDCDLLLAIGARFDDRATGRLTGFAPDAKVIHFDIDRAEVGKLRPADVAVIGSLAAALDGLRIPVRRHAQWLDHCAKRRVIPFKEVPGGTTYGWRDATGLLADLSRCIDDLTITCDVGQHQMWVAQHCRFRQSRRHLSSGGLGTMGYGIPAGIGALLARPGSNVLTVTGDGSIMMNIQELATIARYKLPLKILLLDNQRLGMVRQWQTLFHDGRLSQVDLSDNPDFCLLARSFGIDALELTDDLPLDYLVGRLTAPGPLLMHMAIDPEHNVWPLVPPGHSNDSMIHSTVTEEFPCTP